MLSAAAVLGDSAGADSALAASLGMDQEQEQGFTLPSRTHIFLLLAAR